VCHGSVCMHIHLFWPCVEKAYICIYFKTHNAQTLCDLLLNVTGVKLNNLHDIWTDIWVLGKYRCAQLIFM
jgi:hypothetical protein